MASINPNTIHVKVFNPTSHSYNEYPIRYFDFFAKHQKGNPTGIGIVQYDSRRLPQIVKYIENSLKEGYEIQTWNEYYERVNIVEVIQY